MRLFLDACVLYPTVMREILLGVASAGAFRPFWSPRVLEEWARAALRNGPGLEEIARAEIALMRASWRESEVTPEPDIEATLSLPDLDDRHVLAAAIKSRSDAIVTLNLRDFPTRAVGRYGLLVRAPDPLLLDLATESDIVRRVVGEVWKKSERISGRSQPLRPLLKRAGLPRLGKFLSA